MCLSCSSTCSPAQSPPSTHSGSCSPRFFEAQKSARMGCRRSSACPTKADTAIRWPTMYDQRIGTLGCTKYRKFRAPHRSQDRPDRHFSRLLRCPRKTISSAPAFIIVASLLGNRTASRKRSLRPQSIAAILLRRSSSSLRSGPRFSSEDGARVRMTVCRPDFGRGGAVEVHEVVPTVMTRFRSAEGVPVAVDA